MIQAWLVYNREDYSVNSFFANELINYAAKKSICLQLIYRDEILLGIENNVLLLKYNTIKSRPSIVINRSRDSFLAKHLELMGIRVYNSYQVTHLCNHKARTHQFISKLGVEAVDTFFFNKAYFDIEALEVTYPVILKSVSGHGGSEVFKSDSKENLCRLLTRIKEDEFLIQKICDNPGVDVRVFAIGSKIIGAIKRESKTDFRSNYSLGGEASIYQLTKANEILIGSILEHLNSDFVGIDFMINQKGEFLFNEIEDVVGSRTLYKYGQINTAKEYINYIASKL